MMDQILNETTLTKDDLFNDVVYIDETSKESLPLLTRRNYGNLGKCFVFRPPSSPPDIWTLRLLYTPSYPYSIGMIGIGETNHLMAGFIRKKNELTQSLTFNNFADTEVRVDAKKFSRIPGPNKNCESSADYNNTECVMKHCARIDACNQIVKCRYDMFPILDDPTLHWCKKPRPRLEESCGYDASSTVYTYHFPECPTSCQHLDFYFKYLQQKSHSSRSVSTSV